MIGVKNFINLFKEEKDWGKIAKSKAKDRGISVEELLEEWEEIKQRGIRVHGRLQSKAEELDNVETYYRTFEYNKEGERVYTAPEKDEKLENDKIYLERPIFSHKQGLLGYPDRIDVVKNTIHLQEYKTWDELRRTSVTKVGNKVIRYKMKRPVSHIDDCNFQDAVLQLSIYMYLLWENNRHLKVGKLEIRHITLNDSEDIIGEDIYEVPYLRQEVRDMLSHKRANKL